MSGTFGAKKTRQNENPEPVPIPSEQALDLSEFRRALLGERLDAFLDLGAAHALAVAEVANMTSSEVYL